MWTRRLTFVWPSTTHMSGVASQNLPHTSSHMCFDKPVVPAESNQMQKVNSQIVNL